MTPTWDGLGAMPFSLDELVATARDYLTNRYGFSEEIPVAGIWLQRVDRTSEDEAVRDRWFLTVSFGGEASGILESSVRVLSDGRIITPEKAD